MNYTGIKCPVCGLPFQEEDDVVVCPDCGAPYHRHCYEQEGKCVFADTHETGKRWAPPVSEADTAEHKEELICPACGRHNQPDAAFCNQCGAPIGTQQSAAQGAIRTHTKAPATKIPAVKRPPTQTLILLMDSLLRAPLPFILSLLVQRNP